MHSTLTKQQQLGRAMGRHLEADFFRALADETRLTLLQRLASASRPITVGEASDCCGTHLSGVSRHLAILKRAGIVESEKDGREVYYRLNYKAMSDRFGSLLSSLGECQRCCTTDER